MNYTLFQFLLTGSLDPLSLKGSKEKVLSDVSELGFRSRINSFEIFDSGNLTVIFYKKKVVSIIVSLYEKPIHLPKSIYNG